MLYKTRDFGMVKYCKFIYHCDDSIFVENATWSKNSYYETFNVSVAESQKRQYNNGYLTHVNAYFLNCVSLTQNFVINILQPVVPEDKKLNVTETEAREHCMKSMEKSAAFSTCSDLNTFNVEQFIDICTMDVTVSKRC